MVYTAKMLAHMLTYTCIITYNVVSACSNILVYHVNDKHMCMLSQSMAEPLPVETPFQRTAVTL